MESRCRSSSSNSSRLIIMGRGSTIDQRFGRWITACSCTSASRTTYFMTSRQMPSQDGTVFYTSRGQTVNVIIMLVIDMCLLTPFLRPTICTHCTICKPYVPRELRRDPSTRRTWDMIISDTARNRTHKPVNSVPSVRRSHHATVVDTFSCCSETRNRWKPRFMNTVRVKAWDLKWVGFRAKGLQICSVQKTLTRTLTLEPHTACRKGGWGAGI